MRARNPINLNWSGAGVRALLAVLLLAMLLAPTSVMAQDNLIHTGCIELNPDALVDGTVDLTGLDVLPVGADPIFDVAADVEVVLQTAVGTGMSVNLSIDPETSEVVEAGVCEGDGKDDTKDTDTGAGETPEDQQGVEDKDKGTDTGTGAGETPDNQQDHKDTGMGAGDDKQVDEDKDSGIGAEDDKQGEMPVEGDKQEELPVTGGAPVGGFFSLFGMAAAAVAGLGLFAARRRA